VAVLVVAVRAGAATGDEPAATSRRVAVLKADNVTGARSTRSAPAA